MFYIDTQKTTTRRDSSLILEQRTADGGDILDNLLPNIRSRSSSRVSSCSTPLRGSFRRDLITIMFDSMLGHIVESWEVIPENTNVAQHDNLENTLNVLATTARDKKKTSKTHSKIKGSPSTIIEIGMGGPCPSQTLSLFAKERAIIRFQNGNIYEGGICMKLMNGSGRFQWADGTIYMGNFSDNKIVGGGVIYWKNDTWYEGQFAENLRHGTGTYVDSRKQLSYIGEWHLGTKHGEGTIYYDGTFNNSYDGEWKHNIRHGFGVREYCYWSGYKGEWEYNVRDGKGLMIWPNHDFYRGGWKNGVMSEYGVYVWNNHANKTMVLPSLNVYRGQWVRGKRDGLGVLHFGLLHGALYKGEFKENKKNGPGKLITNSGQVYADTNLFSEDILGYNTRDINSLSKQCRSDILDLQLCDVYYGLTDQIEDAIRNFDRENDIRNMLLEEYIKNNNLKLMAEKIVPTICSSLYEIMLHKNIRDFILFEKEALRKVIHRYEKDLKHIYYQYATACATSTIYFTPTMIRLFLWQLYYDCNILEYGLTFVELDEIFYRKPELLARTAHNPFEKIHFWQFVHSLISVAIKLHAKKSMTVKKPETNVTEAFSNFMDTDVLPRVGLFRGNLMKSYGRIIPIRRLYEIYCGIGEPHTIRQFLMAARHPVNDELMIQPVLMQATDDEIPFGHNGYVIADELTFITDEPLPVPRDMDYDKRHADGLPLYNIGNLTSKTIIRMFEELFPNVYSQDKLLTLDIKLTFFEFYEVLLNCMHESIRLSWEEDKEMTETSKESIV